MPAPEKFVYRGTLYDAAHPDGIAGRFEAYDDKIELFFVKSRFAVTFIPDDGEPYITSGDWKFEQAKA